jgi:Tfp pilus assembly protein PilN
MRDLEFLPQWYSQLEHRRRTVMLQLWIALALVAGLGLWLTLVKRNQRAAECAMATISGELAQTNTQLQQMDRLESLRRQWRQKAEVLGRLGIHVESGKLIGKLAEALPENVSLLGLNAETEETPLPLSAAAMAALKNPASPPMDRRLRVRVQGVAPTDVELATFLTELNKVPFLEQVTPTYARDLPESGHILREFEVTFSVNLNGPAGS